MRTTRKLGEIKTFSLKTMEETSDRLEILFGRPVARGVRGATHPPNLPKDPLSATKWAKKWGFCRRVGGGEVQKVHFLGVPHPPPHRSWLRACYLDQRKRWKKLSKELNEGRQEIHHFRHLNDRLIDIERAVA